MERINSICEDIQAKIDGLAHDLCRSHEQIYHLLDLKHDPLPQSDNSFNAWQAWYGQKHNKLLQSMLHLVPLFVMN
jgi:hypothetical protein